MDTMYYEVSIKFNMVQETGSVKKVTLKYLVVAVSFADAEKKASEFIKPYVSSEYDVCAIKRTKVAEIFLSKNDAADRYYSAKVVFITLDERTALEKRTVQQVMVKATDFDDAREALQEGMRGTLGDWEKAQLSETTITDVIE